MPEENRLRYLIERKKEELNGPRWLIWQAVFSKALTYTEAAELDMSTLYEAIAASEKFAELQNAANQARK